MASNSQGIQQLLQAEKAAADKVAEARKSKLLLCAFVIKRWRHLLLKRFFELIFIEFWRVFLWKPEVT